jgi:DNA-binding XRE family transcriptional regulator
MQFMSLKTFQVLGSRATSLDRRRRRHGSGAPALQRGGDRQLCGHRATAAVSPLLKEVNGCRGHSVMRGLGLKPLWIKRLVRVHRPSRTFVCAVPVSPRRKERRFAGPKEIHTGDDKENRNGKRGRKAPPEAKSPLGSHRQTEFSVLLKRTRDKAGKSRYSLAQFSGVDEAYILRLESGERQNPSRDVVVKLGLALVFDSRAVTLDDVNSLLLAATYAPLLGRGETYSWN